MKIKEIFDKEAFTLRYWLHIAMVSFLVLLILQLIFHGSMLTVKNILYTIPIIGVADVITHATFKAFGFPV